MLDDVSSNIVFESADKLTYRHVKAMCAGACGLMLTIPHADNVTLVGYFVFTWTFVSPVLPVCLFIWVFCFDNYHHSRCQCIACLQCLVWSKDFLCNLHLSRLKNTTLIFELYFLKILSIQHLSVKISVLSANKIHWSYAN